MLSALWLADTRRGKLNVLRFKLENAHSGFRLATGTWAPQKGEQPGFGVSLSIKDADHALQAASDVKATLPAFQIARDNMVRAREHGGESMDSSSMYGPVREDSGLPFFDENTKRKQ